MQIAEAQGIVNVEEMHSLQEKLQVLNEDLATAQEKKHLLEKQLKSIEVNDDKTLFYYNSYNTCNT